MAYPGWMVDHRRQWLVHQILEGQVSAATTADMRLADDDFCEAIGNEAYKRRAAHLPTATEYLSRVIDLEARFRSAAKAK